MGGNPDSGEIYYNRNVGSSSLLNESAYDTVGSNSRERKVHKNLDPKNSNRDCLDLVVNNVISQNTPIVVISDFTSSRGKDIEIIDQKLPMLIGQIMMKAYVSNPTISFAGLGDATCDVAPIQVGQFYFDDKIDSVLSRMWPEKGGGGTGQESYQLMAYYYAYHANLDCNKRGKKGYLFFIGDEGFYPKVAKEEVKKIIGDDISEDLDSKAVFADLQEKFEVFFLFPQKSWEERKEAIDMEIKQRVEQAGGLHDGVDIRASLIWHNRNDLDLHVFTPAGEELCYRSPNKKSSCGGFLDVDMNVKGETEKPVENIQWRKGTAPRGKYKVVVQNYRFHESDNEETPFKVEVEINGKIQSFEKIMPKYQTRENSNITILEFDYDPNERKSLTTQNSDEERVYDNYDEKIIKKQWQSVIPESNLIIFENPKAIVDVILGVLALAGGMEIENYIDDMKDRGQKETRQNEVRDALSKLAEENIPVITSKINLPKTENDQIIQGGNTRRL